MNTDSKEDAPPDSSLIRGIREEKETSKQLKLYNRQLRDINKKLRRRYAVLKAELANISNEAELADEFIIKIDVQEKPVTEDLNTKTTE